MPHEVVDWDYDAQGEAEFWPSGEHQGVALVFRSSSAVAASEIVALDELLSDLSEEDESYVSIAHMLSMGELLGGLSADAIQDAGLHIFSDSSFYNAKKSAAFELFETFWPEEYQAWEQSSVPGLDFDWEHFLDGPEFSAEEYQLDERRYVVVTSN